MKQTRMRVVATVLLIAQTGCMTGPKLVRTSPKDYLEANSPSRVWATMADGQRVVIDGPRVISDSVFGWAEGEEFVVPSDSVQELRVRRVSVVRTAIIPTVLVGGIVAAAVLLTKKDSMPGPTTICEECVTEDAIRQLPD